MVFIEAVTECAAVVDPLQALADRLVYGGDHAQSIVHVVVHGMALQERGIGELWCRDLFGVAAQFQGGKSEVDAAAVPEAQHSAIASFQREWPHEATHIGSGIALQYRIIAPRGVR